MYYREITIAGRTIYIQEKASSRIKGGMKKRKGKQNVTTEAQKKINDRNAERDLAIKLNHNFRNGDYHLVLTYREAPDQSKAKKNLTNFLQNVRRWSKKQGIEFKYIAVTEYEHTRIHHHVVCSKMDEEVLTKYWKHGYVKTTRLDETGNYQKLAAYLLKETNKTFREADNPTKRRYTCSRNIVTPPNMRQEMKGKPSQEIKAFKGYYVDQDSIKVYDHAILEVKCREYMLVSLDDEPRIKRWSKGQKVKLEGQHRINAEEQLNLVDLIDKLGW